MNQQGKPQISDDKLKSYWYPDRTADIEEVNIGYRRWTTDYRILYLSLIPLSLSFLYVTIQIDGATKVFLSVGEQMRKEVDPSHLWILTASLVGGFVTFIFVVAIYFLKKSRPVFLVQFATYQPPDHLKIPHQSFIEKSRSAGFFDQESLDFQEKLIYRTGLGDETYFPPGIIHDPPILTMEKAREEANMVLSGCLDQIFKTTNVRPQDIDILVVNCSLFNPTPSLAEMMMNKYKMRSDIKFFNLSGMGCSASVPAIDLAKDLLQVHKNSLALICSTENITLNWYTGNQKSKLISNTIFRMGGAAILLSNRFSDRFKAKYQLEYIVRVNKSANDTSYQAVYQDADAKDKVGVSISRDLVKVAGDALKSNLTILGPLVLPWSEQIKFFFNLVQRKYFDRFGNKEKKTPAYVPDFKKAFDHFCIHAGGRAIIDGLEENLKLDPLDVEPSRATLYRYGNTSSSSIWYELNYIEGANKITRGETVFQIALGSGFQCNSAVWRRLK